MLLYMRTDRSLGDLYPCTGYGNQALFLINWESPAGGYGVMQVTHSDPSRLENSSEVYPALSPASLLRAPPSQVCV